MTTTERTVQTEPVAALASPKLESSCLQKRSDLVSLAVVVLHLALALVPVYWAAWLGPGWHLVPLTLWLGLVMNGLLNLMHEASHFSVFRKRWASDLLGDWLLGPLVLTDFRAYRHRHWDHHRHLGRDRDTKDAYLVKIRGWRLPWLLVSCLLLIEAVKKFVHGLGGAGQRSTGWILRGAVIQLVFLATLVWASGGDLWRALVAWLVVYHYGVASLTVFMATLRAIAEHQVDSTAPVVVGRAALRNFRDNPISRLLLGAYGFSEHASHHLHPQVPSYRLPAATRSLVDSGRDDLVLGPGYVPTLYRLFRQDP